MISTLLILLVVTVVLLAMFTAFGFRLRFKPSRSRLFIGVVTYVVSFVSVAAVSFLLVMVIAGPHSGVLEPGIYTQITFLAGLFTIVVIPVVAVYAVLRRAHRSLSGTRE